jgi:hypothetical protein
MKYMALIYADPTGLSSRSVQEREAITQEYFALAQDPRMVHSDQLQPGSTATTVRVRDGETLTTDGPFVETKEELGGYYLFEANDLDEAIEIAARMPASRTGGAIEVRPVVERLEP